jgi:hypothetical protein
MANGTKPIIPNPPIVKNAMYIPYELDQIRGTMPTILIARRIRKGHAKVCSFSTKNVATSPPTVPDMIKQSPTIVEANTLTPMLLMSCPSSSIIQNDIPMIDPDVMMMPISRGSLTMALQLSQKVILSVSLVLLGGVGGCFLAKIK